MGFLIILVFAVGLVGILINYKYDNHLEPKRRSSKALISILIGEIIIISWIIFSVIHFFEK